MSSSCLCHSGAGGTFSSAAAQPHHAPDLRLEPRHLDLDLRLDVDGRRAEGVVIHTVVARTEGPRELVLDAVALGISAVEDADGHELSWHHDGEKLGITWAEGVPRGDERRVRVAWSVESPLTGLLFSGPDDAYPNAPRWAATDHETERARHWLPCLDHLSVRTPLDIAIRAHSGFTILGPGLQVGEEAHDDGTKTVRWRLEQPCPSYLLCIAVGDFVRADGGEVDGREIAFFAPAPFTEEQLSRSFGITAEMMQWMQTRLGVPFPYPKYFQFAVEGIGGAMENISLVSWEARFVCDELLSAEWGWRVDLVNLHEMAHSYFGDLVVCRDFSQTWLKESWATYMPVVWLGDTQGDDELHFRLHEQRTGYFDEADNHYARAIVTRTFDSSWDMFDRHLYPGGSVRLHMLRRRLGDHDFWEGVRIYIERHAGGTAETDDFRRALEEASGQTLTAFFDQWLYSPGYPKLKATSGWSGERGELTLTVEQTQADAGRGIGLFELPLEVALETEEGWIRRRLPITGARHVLVLELAAKPTQIVLDPDGDLVFGLEFKAGEDSLTRQLREGPSMAARMQAAVLLGTKPGRKAVATLAAVARSEPFWGLRVIIAKALGGAKTTAAAQAIAELLLSEKDPRAMHSLTIAAGSVREPALEAALLEWLARPDRPHLAAASGYASLGAQRGDEAANAAVLRDGIEDDGLHGLRRRGALQGLAKQRSSAGRDLLSARLPYGADSHYVRGMAAEALGGSARFGSTAERTEAMELLADTTRDPNYGVRMAAVRALASLGEAPAASAVRAAVSSFAAQDHPRVHKAASRLAKAGVASESARLTKSLERLQDTVRGLRERIETLEGRQEA
ncbi:MAG: HEAT repeat domain-containing protein [Deltaproteobacteria bacterium]|nr:HEAT repeat domain-containing protein [Deltaproteobacteria bacterium]